MHTHSLNAFLPGLGSVRREFEKAFEDIHSRPSSACSSIGGVTIWQNDDQVFLEVDVPGYSVENLNLSFEDGNLKVSGERQWPDDRNKPDFNERRFGKFERTIALPDTVDAATIDAGLSDGILSVSFKKKVEAVPRTVTIDYRGKANPTSDAS